MWDLASRSRSRTSKSRSRLLWQSLGLDLVSKFEPGLGLGLGDYGLDYITGFLSTIYKIGNNLHISGLRVSLCYAKKFHNQRTRIVELRFR